MVYGIVFFFSLCIPLYKWFVQKSVLYLGFEVGGVTLLVHYLDLGGLRLIYLSETLKI